MVLFSVADHGAGIPAEEVGRVFERFYRVERGDARETYGHGLGLYIARKIVEAHGGRIWAESRPGAGATFLFTLPAAPEEP
jgi:signal transduction histidine kinase